MIQLDCVIQLNLSSPQFTSSHCGVPQFTSACLGRPFERAGPSLAASPSQPRPAFRLVSVAKDAASVGCQDGCGGVAVATSAVAPRGHRPRRCRRHSRRSHCEARTAAAEPATPVTRGPADARPGAPRRGRERPSGHAGGAEVKDAGGQAGSPERRRARGRRTRRRAGRPGRRRAAAPQRLPVSFPSPGSTHAGAWKLASAWDPSPP